MSNTDSRRRLIKTTCPRDCYDACGMVAAMDDNGIRKVMGDPAHHVARGALCGKCAIAYNGAWRDSGIRLQQPLKRIGPKGQASFAPVSWDEALDLIAERMTALADSGLRETVLQAHYTGTVGLIGGWFPNRFFSHYGATEVDPDTVCNKAGHVALDYVFGSSLDGFDPETIKDTKVILVWGANPSHSAPHMHKGWMKGAKAQVVVIDPIATGTARDDHAEHIQLRPGTDAALAFGFLHVAKRHHLLDRAFIERHVLGFEEIEAAIDVADPQVTERRTGVPARLVEKIGIAYAQGPSLIWLGQGMQRTIRGGNAFRAIAALAAGTGQIGKPGAGTCYMNGPATRGIDMAVLTAPEIARGPALVSHMDLAAALEDPARSQLFFTWNCNPLASSPDQGRLRAAMAREDLFTVVCDLFQTDTVAFADIVLPAASFLECDDVIAPYFHHTLSAQVKITDPPGQALPNAEIFRHLARKMGYSAPQLFESDEEIIARILAATPYRGSFADLAEAGTVRLYNEPRMQFADGFPTPSGRIEIASARAESEGHPRIPEPHADPVTPQGKLRIISPASNWQLNSSYANDPRILRQIGELVVHLHPQDAASHGLASGDRVSLSNAAGHLDLKIDISDMVQPGIGLIYKGRWPGREAESANVNILHHGRKSDLGQSTAVHSTEVDIHRLEPAE